jgi:primosomal protein N' (replication factor Y) (superfamily II helicase)
MNPPCVLRVAIDAPLYHCFDYLAPDDIRPEQLHPGVCILVPFQRREIVGVIVSLHQHSEFPIDKLKRAIAIVDEQTRLPATLMSLLTWASDYYQHPIGEVIVGTMPTKIRQGNVKPPQQTLWRLSAGYDALPPLAKSARKQIAAIIQLEQCSQGLTAQALKQCGIATTTLKVLAQKGYLEETQIAGPLAPATQLLARDTPLMLNTEQAHAVSMINEKLGQFQTFLLDGVTGSGKTEVSLHCLQQALALGKQALVLIPEIGLTPQTVSRFQQRFAVPIALIHSGLTHRERLNAWLQAANGEAKIIIGTRSAVFVPLQSPGIIIVDESHDASFKQQEGFRYSARDVAVMRGYLEHTPVV